MTFVQIGVFNLLSGRQKGPIFVKMFNQSRTNGPINAHLTIAQVMPKYNHNNEKQEALLYKFRHNICSSTAINSTTKLFVNAINMYVTFSLLFLEKLTFLKIHFSCCPGNQSN